MMVPKGVNDCKEKFKQLKLEISKCGNNTRTENFSRNFMDCVRKLTKSFTEISTRNNFLN